MHLGTLEMREQPLPNNRQPALVNPVFGDSCHASRLQASELVLNRSLFLTLSRDFVQLLS